MVFNRRTFLKGVGAATAAAASGCRSCRYPAVSQVTAPKFRKPGEKVRLGVIGVGGKGWSDWTPMLDHGELICALCDPDRTQIDKALKHLQEKGVDISQVKCYSDYRKMLDECAAGLDAVTVSTPDHVHAAAAITAMRQGLSCYVQKPLVRTIWEARYFEKVARTCGVVTQMGNQGSSGSGHRRNVELLQQGIIGDVTEVHVWTNRPIWPQGNLARSFTLGAADPIPAHFNWDAWIGPAKMRNFKGNRPEGDYKLPSWSRRCMGVYHQFNWRGFYDFGTGAFGDMACHTMNLPFRGLELGLVEKAECTQIDEPNDVAYPVKSTVCVTYAARESKARPGVKLPAVKLYWYDGNQQPSADLMPQVVATLGKVPNTGCLIIGSKGIICSTNDYGQEAYIAFKDDKKVKSTFKNEACKAISEYIPRRAEKGTNGQYPEFCDAVKGIGPVYDSVHSRCFSDIEHSVPMLEGMLVGCIAQKIPNVVHTWDSANQLFGDAAANELVKPYIRDGWAF